MAVRITNVRGLVRTPPPPSEVPGRRLVQQPFSGGETSAHLGLIMQMLYAANFALIEGAQFQPAPRLTRSLRLVPRFDVITTNSERVLVLEHARVDSDAAGGKLDLYRFHRHASPDLHPEAAGEVSRPFNLRGARRGITSDFRAFSAPSASILPVLTSRLRVRDGRGWRFLDDGERLPLRLKIVVMIHGFLSNVDSAFQNVDFSTRSADTAVLGFDHETVFQTPQANALALAAMLDAHLTFGTPPLALDVICHSRGGLVARAFLNAVAKDRRWTIGRLSTYGSPNQGTTLAADALDILNIAVNAAVKGFLPGIPDIFSSMISEIATHKALPGIDAMTPVKASSIPSAFKAASVLCFESAYSAKSDEWAKRLAYFLWRTLLFRGNLNDLVVDVPYMSLGAATVSTALEDHNHFRYFDPGYHGNKPF